MCSAIARAIQTLTSGKEIIEIEITQIEFPAALKVDWQLHTRSVFPGAVSRYFALQGTDN
jgi:hypothetical protein